MYLGLFKVKVLADGGQQSTQALQGLLVMVFEQLYNAVVHDDLRQHFKLEELTNELDISQWAPPGLVFSLLKLLNEPLLLFLLPGNEKVSGRRNAWVKMGTHFLCGCIIPPRLPPALSAFSQRSRRHLYPFRTPSGIDLKAACGNLQVYLRFRLEAEGRERIYFKTKFKVWNSLSGVSCRHRHQELRVDRVVNRVLYRSWIFFFLKKGVWLFHILLNIRKIGSIC